MIHVQCSQNCETASFFDCQDRPSSCKSTFSYAFGRLMLHIEKWISTAAFLTLTLPLVQTAVQSQWRGNIPADLLFVGFGSIFWTLQGVSPERPGSVTPMFVNLCVLLDIFFSLSHASVHQYDDYEMEQKRKSWQIT